MDGFQRDLVELLPRLRRMARVIARDPADADDLTQTALERALSHREQWAPGSRLDSWIFRIMKNAWIDQMRQKARSAIVMTDESEIDRIADRTVAPMETRLEATAAEQALAALPDDQRVAVALVLIEGLSYREAADALEIPVGTLTSRLVRGRMALVTQLEGAAS